MKTQDALSLLIALEERVARVYFHFFRTFRHDSEMARCWWDMARDEYGHVGILLSSLCDPNCLRARLARSLRRPTIASDLWKRPRKSEISR